MVGDVYVGDRRKERTKLVAVKSNGKPLGGADAALPDPVGERQVGCLRLGGPLRGERRQRGQRHLRARAALLAARTAAAQRPNSVPISPPEWRFSR